MGTLREGHLRLGQPGGAGGRHHHADRNVLPQPRPTSRSTRSTCGTRKAEGISACDYSFHMGVARFDASVEEQLRQIVARGIASFKVFLAYKGAFGIDDSELYHTLRLAKELGVIVTAHCENAELVAEMQAQLLAEGKTGTEWHERSRPVRVEAEGVHHLMHVRRTDRGARLRRPHQQRRCDSGGRRGPAARRQRLDRNGRTLPGARRLVRGEARFRRGQVRDVAAASPAAAPGRALERAGLADHQHDRHRPRAVRLSGPKRNGPRRFHQDPQRHPQPRRPRESRLHLRREARPHRPAARSSTPAARRRPSSLGSFPRKGTIALGADADLVVYDPEYRGKISQKTQLMNVDYSAFEGWPIEGRPRPSPSAAKCRSGAASSSANWATESCSAASPAIFELPKPAPQAQSLNLHGRPGNC